MGFYGTTFETVVTGTTYDFGPVNGIDLEPLEGYTIELIGNFGDQGRTDPLLIIGRTAVPPPETIFERRRFFNRVQTSVPNLTP